VTGGEYRRERIVEFVSDFWTDNGYGPTIREVAQGVGLLAASSARYELVQLRDAGRLTWADGRPRTLRVVQP
jgi:SOS-response transcriptional repressor LexA